MLEEGAGLHQVLVQPHELEVLDGIERDGIDEEERIVPDVLHLVFQPHEDVVLRMVFEPAQKPLGHGGLCRIETEFLLFSTCGIEIKPCLSQSTVGAMMMPHLRSCSSSLAIAMVAK